MNRHSFRWGSLAFAMIFLAAVGQWAVGREDLLTSRQLSLTAAGVLIVLGLVGVAATVRHARPSAPPRSTPPRDAQQPPAMSAPEGPDDDRTAP